MGSTLECNKELTMLKSNTIKCRSITIDISHTYELRESFHYIKCCKQYCKQLLI